MQGLLWRIDEEVYSLNNEQMLILQLKSNLTKTEIHPSI